MRHTFQGFGKSVRFDEAPRWRNTLSFEINGENDVYFPFVVRWDLPLWFIFLFNCWQLRSFIRVRCFCFCYAGQLTHLNRTEWNRYLTWLIAVSDFDERRKSGENTRTRARHGGYVTRGRALEIWTKFSALPTSYALRVSHARVYHCSRFCSSPELEADYSHSSQSYS